jgi:hypothetical protein
VKGASASKSEGEDDSEKDDVDDVDEQSEAQRLADEQKAADLEMEKPKKRSARKGFNNGGEARA